MVGYLIPTDKFLSYIPSSLSNSSIISAPAELRSSKVILLLVFSFSFKNFLEVKQGERSIVFKCNRFVLS